MSAVPPWFMIHSCTLLDAITSMTTYVSLTSKNTQLMPFLLPSVVHLIDCVLFASTIQTLYKCTFYFYLHFIGFTYCMYYKSVLKIKSTLLNNVLFFVHLGISFYFTKYVWYTNSANNELAHANQDLVYSLGSSLLNPSWHNHSLLLVSKIKLIIFLASSLVPVNPCIDKAICQI